MKKVININFQGQVIAIEETAYELLKQYIESLKKYFSREEGGEEIVNDIENRIAELFGNRLKLGIHCITDEDVASIISNIGRPEDFDSEYQEIVNPESVADEKEYFSNNPSEPEARTLYRNVNDKMIGGVCSGLAHYFRVDPILTRIVFILFFSVLFWVYLLLWIVLKPKALESNVKKRLYRNPNNRFLGGVCGGIAAYFKIDAWIPRLIFSIPLIVSLIGKFSIPFFPLNAIFDNISFGWNINLGAVLIYAVLWIIIPLATTVKQKLDMMGEDEYIQSLRETVTDNIVAVKSKTEVPYSAANSYSVVSSSQSPAQFLQSMPPEPPQSYSPKASGSDRTKSPRSGCLSALIVFLKIVFFAFVGIFAITILGVLIAFIFTGTHLVDLKSLFIDSGLETTLLWLFGILTIGVPVVAVITWIIRRSIKAVSRPVIGVVALILWVGGIVCGISLALNVAEKFEQEESVEKTIELTPIGNQTLYVEMLPYKTDYYKFRGGFGPGSHIDGMAYYNEREDSLLFENINLRVVDSRDSFFHVTTIGSSYERKPHMARNNAEQFTYDIQQEDSLLFLSEFFLVPIDQGFRLQELQVEIAVPKGNRVVLSNDLEIFQKNKSRTKARKKNRKYLDELSDND